MKIYTLTKSVALAAILVALSSCDKFLDVNVNPSTVLSAPAPNVLIAAESGLGFTMGSDLHRYTSLIAQQFAGQGGSGSQQAEYDRYNITPTDVNNVWRGSIYSGTQADLQKLIDQTQSTSPAYSGMAKIMQGFLYSVTTDAFGDIPFSEALRFDQNFQPRYDASAEVYRGIIVLLNSGIDDLRKTSTLTPGSDDLIYAGDLVKWTRFANTLKLRLYLHTFPLLSTTANADFAAVLAAGPVMTANSDNFQLAFEAVANRTNPIHQYELSRANGFFPSATLVNLMNSKADPRRTTYFTESGGTGVYTGAGNGTGVVGAPVSTFSRMSTYLRGASTGTEVNSYDGAAPIRMLTFAEHNFILAEYYARTGDLSNAQSSFIKGITASLTMAGIAVTTSSTGAAYLAARPPLTVANAIQQIVEEKYVANYGVAVEPWSDYRRTRFPVLSLPANALLPQIIRILPYPELERITNPNTPARPDLTAKTVFWDPGR